jgi:hypothetical protein
MGNSEGGEIQEGEDHYDLNLRMREIDVEAREEDLADRRQQRRNRQRILFTVIGVFVLLNIVIPAVILLGAINAIAVSKIGMTALTGTLFPEVGGLVYMIVKYYFTN